MSCAPADRLIQSIKVAVPGVTDDMINLVAFNIVDEFLRRTQAWIHKDEIKLEQGIVDYSYGVPAGAEFVRMLSLHHNNIPVPAASTGGTIATGGARLDPALTFSDGDATFLPDASDMNVDIFSWAVYRPDVISINVPSADLEQYPAVAAMVLSVGKGCLECDSCGDWQIPEWMWSMYFQDWLDGVLGRLYGMPAKPWASITHAQYHGRRFRNWMAYRKQETMRGFVYGSAPASPTWRFPGGWAR